MTMQEEEEESVSVWSLSLESLPSDHFHFLSAFSRYVLVVDGRKRRILLVEKVTRDSFFSCSY